MMLWIASMVKFEDEADVASWVTEFLTLSSRSFMSSLTSQMLSTKAVIGLWLI